MARKILAAFAIAFLAFDAGWAGPVHSQPEEQAVGTWYGEFAPPGRPVQRFLTIRTADGTFTLHARLYENGAVTGDLHNSGLWGISNGLYFTVTTDVDGMKTEARSPQVINAYLIEKQLPDRIDYVHVASGNRFTVRRVDPQTARLPD